MFRGVRYEFETVGARTTGTGWRGKRESALNHLRLEMTNFLRSSQEGGRDLMSDHLEHCAPPRSWVIRLQAGEKEAMGRAGSLGLRTKEALPRKGCAGLAGKEGMGRGGCRVSGEVEVRVRRGSPVSLAAEVMWRGELVMSAEEEVRSQASSSTDLRWLASWAQTSARGWRLRRRRRRAVQPPSHRRLACKTRLLRECRAGRDTAGRAREEGG